MALLKWLVMGHTHKWVTLEVIPIWGTVTSSERVYLGDAYMQQCEKCGHVRRVDLN